MRKERYSDFHYRIVKPTEPGYVRVEVTFKFKGLSTKHYIFLDEKKGVDYIAEAKKQIAEDIRKDRLDRVAHKHHINPVKVFGLTFIGLAVAAAVFAPLAAKFTKALKTFTVKFDMNTVYYPTGAPVPKTQSVLENRKAVEPGEDDFTHAFYVDPELWILSYYYEFLYWTERPEDESPAKFNFNTRINADVTLYAHWYVW